jgi:pyoverdine/dityrosine biosynthesis protein Dit1
MKIIQRCNTKRCKTVVSLYNPGIEFTILADNTMLEATTRRVTLSVID